MEKHIDFYDFLDIQGLTLDVTRYPNQGSRFTCSIEGSDVQDKSKDVLLGIYGTGSNFVDAIEDYVKSIKGKTIVINAFTKERREIIVPNNLKYI